MDEWEACEVDCCEDCFVEDCDSYPGSEDEDWNTDEEDEDADDDEDEEETP